MKALLVFLTMAFALSACSSPDPKQEENAKKQRMIWQQDKAKESYEEMDKKTGN